jgi:ketosteroid isomerase-like protein
MSADDWVAIYELRSAYAWHYDSPDLDALVDIFTEDAVCEFGPYGRWDGRAEIRAGFAENVGAPDNHFPSLHAVTNPQIAIDGDEATGRWFLLDFVLTGGPGELPFRVAGVYQDRYRKVDGRWLIAFTHLDFLWNSEVGRMAPDAARKLNWHADD